LIIRKTPLMRRFFAMLVILLGQSTSYIIGGIKDI
jgi:hypothetical protein